MIGSLMRIVAVKIAMSRKTKAPTRPYVSARFCWCFGKRLASRPSTSALSIESTPSRTISSRTTAMSEPSARCPKNSMAERTLRLNIGGGIREELSPENPVAGVAEAGQDVALLVQLAVDSGRVDRDVGVGLVQRVNPLRRRDEADEFHAGHPRLLQHRNGRTTAATGGEHRVYQQDLGRRDVGRELLIVADRLERFFVAVHAQVTEPRVRQELQDPVSHSQSGAKNRDERHLPREHAPGCPLQRRLHGLRRRGPVARD